MAFKAKTENLREASNVVERYIYNKFNLRHESSPKKTLFLALKASFVVRTTRYPKMVVKHNVSRANDTGTSREPNSAAFVPTRRLKQKLTSF